MLSCEHLSSLFFYNGFTSLTLGWLSTHILIEKCTLKKNRVHFPFFRVHFPESRCSGKLFLDTEGVIFVQQMYNERHENTYVVQTCPQARQEAAMKYTLEERLEIGRRIYDGEISRYEAAEQFGINDQTARNYMRMYRDANQLPPKQGKRAGSTLLLKNDHAGIDDLAAMTKEELIHELIKARITEARLKKGYEVKGDGTVVLYGSKNTK